jgi:hypothetical protein
VATQYFCRSERRRRTVLEHASLNGIDYLEVLDLEAVPLGMPRQRTLLVYCLKALPDPAVDPADALGSNDVRILGGVRVTPVEVEWAARAAEAASLRSRGLIETDEARDFLLALPDPDHVLVVRTDAEGDFSTYRLCLVEGDLPHPDFAPLLAEVDFSFKVECPSEFDCAPREECPPEPKDAPPIDYLAKDYASFRQLMLDRLSVVMPDWKERNPPDVGIAVVEVLAYAADQLSYFQDAAATETYLGTARRRPSAYRHARLLDYPMHDGVNARVWVAVEVEPGVGGGPGDVLRREFPPGRTTRFLTRVPDRGTRVAPEDLDALVAEHGPQIFEPLFDLPLHHVHNEISFYTWGDRECCLPRGATRATVRGRRKLPNGTSETVGRLDALRPGDVLVFEEVLGTDTGHPADADPARRHAVRLTRVAMGEDPLGGRFLDPPTDDPVEVTEIEWAAEDALPFPLCLSTVIERDGEEVPIEGVSRARGNVVLADHGRTVPTERLATPTGERRYRPRLREPDVVQRVPLPAEEWDQPPGTEGWLSATAALRQDPRRALPAIRLLSAEGEDWHPERDLLGSDRFDPDFVVETESDGRAALRFGDGLFGRAPEAGVDLDAGYRVGRGPAADIGAGAIRHVVAAPGLGITAVTNPLPAAGGTAPERLEEVRQYAPQAFRTQERAVTEEDYAAVAERHPEVGRAVARRLWTGSWHTVFITVDRAGGRTVDREFEDELSEWVERFQLAGHDVEIEPPRFVPLDVALAVCVEPGHRRSAVLRALLETFGTRDLPDGRRGFFHPDALTFGQPVYLSRLIAEAMAVPGVRWVRIDPHRDPPGRFQRWGEKPRGEIAAGRIDVGRLEVAVLDNDPNAPENGRIEFSMEGGQ